MASRLKSEAAQFAAEFVDSPEYRESIRRRIAHDRLPPAVEGLLLAYRFGKPTERKEVYFPEGVPDYSGLSTQELAQRALEIQKDLLEAKRLAEGVNVGETLRETKLSDDDLNGIN